MKSKQVYGIILLTVLVFLGIWFKIWQFASFISPENIKNLLLSTGPWSPLLYAALYGVASFIPFLSPVMSVAGGLAFGVIKGTIITVIVATLAATLPFFLVKHFGKDWAQKKLQGTKFEKYHHKADRNSFLFVFYMRLIPIVPYELQHYIAGLTNISTGKYMLATLLGILPGTFAFSFLGESITDIGGTKFWIAIGVFVVAFIVPLSIHHLQNKQKKKGDK